MDSGLPVDAEGNPTLEGLSDDCFASMNDEEVAKGFIEIIRDFKPHVIITYDENGGYPHPDHLMVHRASMIAWDRAGDENYAPELGPAWQPLKLYYSHGFVYQRMQLFHDALLEAGRTSPYESMMARWKAISGDIMERVTTQVECAEYFPQREAALRAHATQIDPAGAFLATEVSVQQQLWPTEEFELVHSHVPTTLPENDLFAGIDGNSV